jgi:hypothetical protein
MYAFWYAHAAFFVENTRLAHYIHTLMPSDAVDVSQVRIQGLIHSSFGMRSATFL